MSEIIPSVVLLRDVRPNSDHYDFNQLTCFHKPMAILAESVQRGNFNKYLLYSTYYENFMVEKMFHWRDFFGNMNDRFQEFATQVLLPDLGLDIHQVEYTDELSFAKAIEQCIAAGRRVLVPVDLVYLPYYLQYKKDHHVHFIIVRGYDTAREIFHILDNMHIDGGSGCKYVEFALEYGLLYRLAKAYAQLPGNKVGRDFFWTMTKSIQTQHAPLDTDFLMIWQGRLSRNSRSSGHHLHYPEQELVSTIPWLLGSSRAYAKVLNYREVFYDALLGVLAAASAPQDFITHIQKLVSDSTANWSSLRLDLLYKMNKKQTDFSALLERVELAAKADMELFSLVQEFRNYSGTQDHHEIGQDGIDNGRPGIGTVLNPKGAMVKLGPVIEIFHDNSKKFDTWILDDNAPQVIFELGSSSVFEFSCRVSVVSKPNSPFHCGIVLKAHNDEKLLYGLYELNSIALLKPSDSEWSLFSTFYEPQICTIGVTGTNAGLEFWYSSQASGARVSCLTLDGSLRPKRVGIFSKTWEAVELQSSFSSLTLAIDGRDVPIQVEGSGTSN